MRTAAARVTLERRALAPVVTHPPMAANGQPGYVTWDGEGGGRL
jgi:hypothetical protein